MSKIYYYYYNPMDILNFTKVEPVIASYFRSCKIPSKKERHIINKDNFMIITPVNNNIKELKNDVIYNLGSNFS